MRHARLLLTIGLAGFGAMFFLGVVSALVIARCDTGACEDRNVAEAFAKAATLIGTVGFFTCLVMLIFSRPAPRWPADWYPDPDEPERFFRYWDGRRWTDHRSPR